MCFCRARGARSDFRRLAIFKHKRTANCTAAGSTKHTQYSVGGLLHSWQFGATYYLDTKIRFFFSAGYI